MTQRSNPVTDVERFEGAAHLNESGALSGVMFAPEPTRTALLQEQTFRTDVHDALLVMALPRKPALGETQSRELDVPKFGVPNSYGTADLLPARLFRWTAKLHDDARGAAVELAWTTSAAKQTYAGSDLEQWDESGTAEGRYALDGFVEGLRSSRTTIATVSAAGSTIDGDNEGRALDPAGRPVLAMTCHVGRPAAQVLRARPRYGGLASFSGGLRRRVGRSPSATPASASRTPCATASAPASCAVRCENLKSAHPPHHQYHRRGLIPPGAALSAIIWY